MQRTRDMDDSTAVTGGQHPAEPVIDFSFGTFWNWFLPSCLDVWSGSQSETVIAYGAKSFLFLANARLLDQEWKVVYREIVNVFGYQPKSQFMDAFRSNTNYITTVVFDRTCSVLKHGSASNQRAGGDGSNSTCAMLFLGNSQGTAALYDCHQRITLLQDLSLADISRSCCKPAAQKKILSAAWLHYRSEGPVVYYTLDTHLVVWKVKKNQVNIFHDNQQACSESRFNAGQLQIACLASLPAECTGDKSQHKLAIGYMGGKLVVLGLDPGTGDQLSLTVFVENGHSDDICSLQFAPYSVSLYSAYRNGVLCSVSRDSVLKVWSCHNQNEIAEHRILASGGSGGGGGAGNAANWFTAAFMPRATVAAKAAFEVILSNSSGDLLTFTLPEKDPNGKLRIAKAQKSFLPKPGCEKMRHSFIIFSIGVSLERQIAITISLDYKLLVWNLTSRHSEHVFYTFSNGALAIDGCPADRRTAVAFGSHIFVLDFKQRQVAAQRIGTPFKNAKFYSVIWNRKNLERLGSLIIGTANGELYHLELNSKSKLVKWTCQENSKIYSIIWLQTLLPPGTDPADPAVLTLHQSGVVMVNHLDHRRAQANLDQYLVGVPSEARIKRTAICCSADGQRYLIIGNDDGTVDVFDRTFDRDLHPDKAFRLAYRFRAFNSLCLSIQCCPNTHWISVTAFHENYVACYHLEGCDEPANPDGALVVKSMPTKCRLSGHEDRVSTTCWSPHNQCSDEAELLLGSASYDTTCIIWNVATRLALKRFFGHKSLVYVIRWCHFNPDHLFSGGEDNLFFWNWKQQSDFSPATKAIEKMNVKVNSLRSILNLGQPAEEPAATAAGDLSETKGSSSSLSSSSRTKSSAPLKALLPLSNQIENNSSKYECLDDIKWLIKLKCSSEPGESVPESKLDRILLYGSTEHIERMVSLEIEHHRANKNAEGESLLSLYLDARGFTQRAIERNECDPVVAMFAANLSKDLYSECVEKILAAGTFGTRLKWTNYGKELAALVRLFCLDDFEGAIQQLVAGHLYREALILARVNLASEEFVSELLVQWHRHRIGQNQYEGAIKCLIAAGDQERARQLVHQRRVLGTDTSNAAVLKQYDDILQLLQ